MNRLEYQDLALCLMKSNHTVYFPSFDNLPTSLLIMYLSIVSKKIET